MPVTSFFLQLISFTADAIQDDEIESLSQLVVKVASKMATNTFRPKKFHSINSMKKIALAPLHKYSRRHAMINKEQFFTILRGAGFILGAEPDEKLWMFRVFNLELVNVPDEDAAVVREEHHTRRILTGTFQTDGEAISFIFRRPVREEGNFKCNNTYSSSSRNYSLSNCPTPW